MRWFLVALAVFLALVACGCTRYVITDRAFSAADGLSRDERSERRIAVAASRAKGGETYVGFESLQRDRSARLRVVNPLLVSAIVCAALATGGTIGTIVFGTRPHESGAWIDSSEMAGFALGMTAATAFLGTLALMVAGLVSHPGEVRPDRRDVIYVGADGAVHF